MLRFNKEDAFELILSLTLIVFVPVVALGVIAWVASMDMLSAIVLAGFCMFVLGLDIRMSVKKLRADQMAELYLLGGTRRATIANKSLRAGLIEAIRRKRREGRTVIDEESILEKYIRLGIVTGFLNSNFVIGVWPFWNIWVFPLGESEIAISLRSLFTDNSKEAPQVRMEGAITFTIRFLTLRDAFPVWPALLEFRDLSEVCVRTADEESDVQIDFAKRHHHNRLGHALEGDMQGLIMQAAQKAFNLFAFGSKHALMAGAGGGVEHDLINNKILVEMAILFELGEPGSTLHNAHVIERPKSVETLHSEDANFLQNLRKAGVKPSDFYGPSVISADLNLVSPDFAKKTEGESEASTKFNDAYIGLIAGTAEANKALGEATATKSRGEAETNVRVDRVQKLKAQTVDPNVALMSDQVKGTEVKAIGVQQSIVDAVVNAVKK